MTHLIPLQSPAPKNSPTPTRKPAPPNKSAASPPTSPAGTPGTSPRVSSPRRQMPNGISARTKRHTWRLSAPCSKQRVCLVKPSSTQDAMPLPGSARSGVTGAMSRAPVLECDQRAPQDRAMRMRLCGLSLAVSRMGRRILRQRGMILSVERRMRLIRRRRRDSGTRFTLRSCWLMLSPHFKVVR